MPPAILTQIGGYGICSYTHLTPLSLAWLLSRCSQARSNMGVEKNKERIARPANKTTFVISILATLRYTRLKASAYA